MSSGMAPVYLQKLEFQKRTDGDGMENTEDATTNNEALVSANENSSRYNLIDRLIYRPKDVPLSLATPPDIKGQIVHLLPKHVMPIKKEGSLINVLSSKEPKFVPYEPYKAAVKPIIPYEKCKRKKSSRLTAVHVKQSDSSSDKHIPVAEINSANTNSTTSANASVSNSNSLVDVLDSITVLTDMVSLNNTYDSNSIILNEQEKILPADYEIERKGMEEELKRLKEENEQLESQLKFQAQVNGELKNLLVAAMGEDLETRVHLLTEDKLHLARALLNSAQKLNTHQEQTEYLAGQCEVWRSKFLASSLMVEDLAKWKAALCQKASELQDTMKRILEERGKVRESLVNVHRELSLLCEKFDLTALKGGKKHSGLKTSTVVDLSSSIQTLSFNLRLQLLGDIPKTFTGPDLKNLESATYSERQAEQLLLHPLALFGQPDAACTAVLGAAVALGAGQMHSTPAPACCSHCSGEIKLM